MSTVFILDSNAFMQAKQKFYAFDICPGYWTALVWHQQAGVLRSVDRVREEIEAGGDDLWDWVQKSFPEGGFAETGTAEVLKNYGQLQQWVSGNALYTSSAKLEFAEEKNADGWLIAYAMTLENCVVVTMEDFNAEKRNKVPIPNLCSAFGIESITPFEMLRRLQVGLHWTATPL